MKAMKTMNKAKSHEGQEDDEGDEDNEGEGHEGDEVSHFGVLSRAFTEPNDGTLALWPGTGTLPL